MQELINGINSMAIAVQSAYMSMWDFSRTFRRARSVRSRWKMMNKNGMNTKERKRNQTMLRGRRCRVHKGGYPKRGKGTTTHGRR